MEQVNHSPNSNISLAKSTLQNLLAAGVHEIVLCSGNRNAPFIATVSAQEHARVYHHFSESSASFFALGRIKAHGRPVAVVVTSGTAAVQLGAAAVEAAYAKLPLVLVTADRPARYRGTAAPQSINQVDMFAANLNHSFDIQDLSEVPSADELASLFAENEPVQLNVCFEEPLIDQDPSQWKFDIAAVNPVPAPQQKQSDELKQFLSAHQSPLIIVGRVPISFQNQVRDFLTQLNAPVYAEGLSGLREEASISHLQITAGDALLRKGGFDSILRIGSVPTLGFWRDLERNPTFTELPVLSITTDGFSGLGRSSQVLDLATTKLRAEATTANQSILAENKAFTHSLAELLQKYPQSEPSLVRSLSETIEKDAQVYLGNSMPIRLWDLAAARDTNSRIIEANRGVNGIDGQLSTYLGAALEGRANWCLLGDLTTLYDLEAPYILEQLPKDLITRLVIINNQGGRIFEMLPDYNKYFRDTEGGNAFLQPSNIDFGRFAKLWNLDHLHCSNIPELSQLPTRGVIELQPDIRQTREFWSDYKQLFK